MDPQAFVVDPDIRQAESLPPAAFLEPAFLERELATIFRHHWSVLPSGPAEADLATHLATPGARAPVTLLERPYFLHRSMDGALRGFPNVCTHAWHTLVTAPSVGQAIACPQHGRSFHADGRYKGQPGMPRDLPGFPRACDHLRSMPASTWGPLALMALGEADVSADELLADLQDTMGDLPIAALRREARRHEVREVDGNWKLHAGNYLDTLHIPFIHGQGLAGSVQMDSYQTEVHEHGVLQWAYAKDPALGFDAGLLPARFQHDEHRVFALWWFLFPNITLNFYPWGLSVNLYMPIPGKPDKTAFHWYTWTWDDDKAIRRDAWHMRDVDDEDVEALRQVTQGLRSDEAVRGRFIPGAEAAPHWFQRRVYEAVFST